MTVRIVVKFDPADWSDLLGALRAAGAVEAEPLLVPGYAVAIFPDPFSPGQATEAAAAIDGVISAKPDVRRYSIAGLPTAMDHRS